MGDTIDFNVWNLEGTDALFTGVLVKYPLGKLRLLCAELRRGGDGFSTEQAKALLLIHGDELRGAIDKAVKDFLKAKIG